MALDDCGQAITDWRLAILNERTIAQTEAMR
jgi:hypothetical protein